MQRIRVTQPRSDCLLLSIGADWRSAGAWAAAAALAAGLLALVDLATGPGLALVLLAAGLMPWFAVRAVRATRRRERSLVRTSNRLLLDGEPLELARAELRMVKLPVTNVPTGYVLSLWVMTAAGPEDVPMGRFRTLLEASTLSGVLEDFVQRAGVKASAPRLT